MPFDINRFEDPECSITTMSLLNGCLDHNITIDEYFNSLADFDNERIWKLIDVEVEKTLKSILVGGDLDPDQLSNNVSFLGFDVMLKGKGREIKPYIIEVNHMPTIYRGKENDPDDKINSFLDRSYTSFFQDLKTHVFAER